MRPTKFSGPLLYSGQAINSGFFSDLPIGFNPDFVQHWDDFTGKTVDTTDDYTFTALSGGNVEAYNRDPASAFPSADNLGGWALMQSQLSDPAVVDSGGKLEVNEFVQPLRWRQPLHSETRLGVNNPKNCNLFYGLHVTTVSGTPSAVRVGFELNASDGTGVLDAVATAGSGAGPNGETYVRTNTGFTMPVLTTYAGGTQVQVGDPIDRNLQTNTAPILSMRLVTPGEQDTTRVHFYINRKLVATINNVVAGWPMNTSVYAPVFYYEKKSELSGMTIGEDMDISETGPITILGSTAGSPASIANNNGSGLWNGQVIKIGTELMRVTTTYSNRVGAPTVSLERGYGAPAATTHTAGDAITSATGGCLMDYNFISQSRLPAAPVYDYQMVSPEPKA